ncbi:pentapeptide repeat-containing protein [Helicobacter bilis]|uniref:pentapeptide repeat-containing protein n=1 Tax=Helicobacter bilis TaxID=37372 RepID=UPI0026EDAA91|nr:pentapeptide repeat-containing protein [Helicobacter bilis]MCI7410867.1 pentapeptide repeat-containing protein [Helicobacter bilis]MDD7297301.1 pentapeptide repeat-containing protein [Helicobacter bilis]MDY4400112.1 pentapeptide repeat-containing protein [Helicobacter bilis]
MNLTTSGTHNLTTLGIYANNIEKIEKQEQKIFIYGGVIDKIDFEILQKTGITYLEINLSKIKEITFPQCTNLEIYFSGVTFDNVVRFKSKFYGALEFASCVFNNNAVFENATFNNVEFIYCVFNQQAKFIKSVFENTERLQAKQFSDTKFLGPTRFSDNIFHNNIGFYNVEFQKELIIRDNRFECDRVVFSVTCQAKVTCMFNYFKHEIVINESGFNHDVLLSIDFSKMTLIDSKIIGHLHFNTSKGKKVEIQNSIINGDMALAYAAFGNMLIQQSSFNKGVDIFVENFSNTEVIKISDTTFNLLFIQKEIFKKSVIFEKCMFLKSIDFKEYEFQKVAFNTCIFSGNMYFNNAVFKDSMDFHECEFEKTACFYGVTFEKSPNFSQTIFKSSLNIVNTNLNFDFENLNERIKQEYQNFNANKGQENKKTLDKFANDFRDSFRLIKNALIKDNNLLDASNFHKYELYCKEIELDSKNSKTLKDRIDKLQLCFYRITSNHHTDLLKIINNIVILIAVFAYLLFVWRCCSNTDFLQYFVDKYSNNGLVNILSNTLFKTEYFHTLMIVGFMICVCLAVCDFVLFCVGTNCNPIKSLRILSAWIFFFCVILINPKYILGIGGFIGGSVKATGAIENLLFVMYSIVMFLFLFSLQKTARKNSIIPH